VRVPCKNYSEKIISNNSRFIKLDRSCTGLKRLVQSVKTTPGLTKKAVGVLAATGYVANAHQSANTLLGIKGTMTLYPAVALLLAAIIIGLMYNLSDDKFKKIADDLNHGRWENGNFLH
jgi:Na+/melibiose symporter-like transporter